MAFGVDPSAYASQELSVFDDLLAALSRRLDVRDLFEHLSAFIGRIVSHDEAQLILLGQARTRSWPATRPEGPVTIDDRVVGAFA